MKNSLARFRDAVRFIAGILRRSELAPNMPSFRHLRQWFMVDENALAEIDRTRLASTLEQSTALKTIYAMRRDLAALWGRSADSCEDLLARLRLKDWCQRAEASNIVALQYFSRRLRSYA